MEAFTEETARTRRFPGIAFRGDDAARRPWVLGTGLDVWEIIQMLEDAGSGDELVATSHLTARQVQIAEAYRERHPDEIAEAIADNRRSPDELRALFPFVVAAPSLANEG